MYIHIVLISFIYIANYTEAPSSDIVISKTTDIVMSTVSQTQTTNASSSLPTLPVASVIPGRLLTTFVSSVIDICMYVRTYIRG